MDHKSLERLERIARNLPILGEPELLRTESPWGQIYMALGADASGILHGLWSVAGVTDIAQTVQFKPTASRTDAIKVMTLAAQDWQYLCNERGLNA